MSRVVKPKTRKRSVSNVKRYQRANGVTVTKKKTRGVTQKADDVLRMKALNNEALAIKQSGKSNRSAEVEKTKRTLARSAAVAQVGSDAFNDTDTDVLNALVAGGTVNQYQDNVNTNNSNTSNPASSNPNGVKGLKRDRYLSASDLGIIK